uniref:Uncharacterized protein n=1 Tax=Meloidogyne enterolobii TaxID=390850 RepID=A0A6V7VYG2_MELEN|nr:unnamed protein product [Meloidogyne enterolobii]
MFPENILIQNNSICIFRKLLIRFRKSLFVLYFSGMYYNNGIFIFSGNFIILI